MELDKEDLIDMLKDAFSEGYDFRGDTERYGLLYSDGYDERCNDVIVRILMSKKWN